MTDHRIYVACLASYNNGVLHGAWIDASADADEMQAEVDAILRTSKFPNVTVEHEGKTVPSAEEYAIHDHEGPFLADIKEYAGLAEVARRMALAETLEDKFDDDAADLFDAYIDHHGAGYCTDADDICSAIEDAYRGKHDSIEAYVEEMAEETGMLNEVPENLRYYFDFAALGRDMEINGELSTYKANGETYVFTWQ